MLMPYENPDDYVSEFEHNPCPFHKIAPGEPYAGCTCAGKYFRRPATPKEKADNIKAREKREERRAEAIRAIGIF